MMMSKFLPRSKPLSANLPTCQVLFSHHPKSQALSPVYSIISFAAYAYVCHERKKVIVPRYILARLLFEKRPPEDARPVEMIR